MYDTIVDGFLMPFQFLLENTDKRIYWLYVLSSIGLALYVYLKHIKGESFLKYLFDKKHWFSKSALVDYYFIFFNSYLKLILIAPFLISGLHLAYNTNEYLMETLGYRTFNLSFTETLIYYTITLTIVGDFATYIVHYLMHRIRFLWEFHKVHHSATVLNPITQYRIHPVELLINNIRGILVFGLTMGVFDYLSAGAVEKFTFLGVNALSFLFLFWGANLRHSHVKLTYFNWLEYILISPFQHQIHHSTNPAHHNKNMGSKFAIWDWLFGTLIKSKEVNDLEFGLADGDLAGNSFFQNLFMPFKNFFLSIFKRE